MQPPQCPSCAAPIGWLDERCAACGCEIEVDAFARAMVVIDAEIEAEEAGGRRPPQPQQLMLL